MTNPSMPAWFAEWAALTPEQKLAKIREIGVLRNPEFDLVDFIEEPQWHA